VSYRRGRHGRRVTTAVEEDTQRAQEVLSRLTSVVERYVTIFWKRNFVKAIETEETVL